VRRAVIVRQTRVRIAAAVAAELRRESQHSAPLETGGVLLGFVDADAPFAVEVLAQAGPGPDAEHRRHRFVPDSAWQTARIADVYSRSGRVITYLGDWHSHPGGSAWPSRLDRRTAARIARSKAARAPRPLMLIVSGASLEELNAYRFARFRLRTAELTVVAT